MSETTATCHPNYATDPHKPHWRWYVGQDGHLWAADGSGSGFKYGRGIHNSEGALSDPTPERVRLWGIMLGLLDPEPV